MDDMGVISTDKNKLSLYYNSESSIGKQCYAYVQSSDKKVLGIDITKTKVTPTQWTELADGLNIPVKDLLDTHHPDFKQKYKKNTITIKPNN
jgi:arsenate reductase-like glutaredoxin family protein